MTYSIILSLGGTRVGSYLSKCTWIKKLQKQKGLFFPFKTTVMSYLRLFINNWLGDITAAIKNLTYM